MQKCIFHAYPQIVMGARCSSVVERLLVVRWVIGSIPHQWRIQTFNLVGGVGWGGVGWGLHGIKLNAEGTVGSFGGRKVIYNKIINHKI